MNWESFVGDSGDCRGRGWRGRIAWGGFFDGGSFGDIWGGEFVAVAFFVAMDLVFVMDERFVAGGGSSLSGGDLDVLEDCGMGVFGITFLMFDTQNWRSRRWGGDESSESGKRTWFSGNEPSGTEQIEIGYGR